MINAEPSQFACQPGSFDRMSERRHRAVNRQQGPKHTKETLRASGKLRDGTAHQAPSRVPPAIRDGYVADFGAEFARASIAALPPGAHYPATFCAQPPLT